MNFIAEAFERRLATRPDHDSHYDELTPKGVGLFASHLEQGAFAFGVIREAVLGRTSLVARLMGKGW